MSTAEVSRLATETVEQPAGGKLRPDQLGIVELLFQSLASAAPGLRNAGSDHRPELRGRVAQPVSGPGIWHHARRDLRRLDVEGVPERRWVLHVRLRRPPALSGAMVA